MASCHADRVYCNNCGTKGMKVVMGACICPSCLSIGTLSFSIKNSGLESEIVLPESQVDKAVIKVDLKKLRFFLEEQYEKTLEEVMELAFPHATRGEYADEKLIWKLAKLNPLRNDELQSVLPSYVLATPKLLHHDDMIDHGYCEGLDTDDKDELYYFDPGYLERTEGIEFTIVDTEKDKTDVVIDVDRSFSINLLRKMKRHHGWKFPATVLLDWDRTKTQRVGFATGSGLASKLRGLNIDIITVAGRPWKEIIKKYK